MAVKRKRQKDENLLGLVTNSHLKNNPQFQEFLKFQAFYEILKREEKLSAKELIEKIENEVLIPASVFTEKLGVLETVCKYLKEDIGLKNKEISKLVSRDSRSVWQAYDKSKKKHPARLKITSTKYFIPATIFQNDKNSILENLVIYLKDKFLLSYHEIALILKRDDRTIWTVYNRGKKRTTLFDAKSSFAKKLEQKQAGIHAHHNRGKKRNVKD